jgi:hypothetical protein
VLVCTAFLRLNSHYSEERKEVKMQLTTLLAPPVNQDAKPLQPLSSEQEKKRLNVLGHFSDSDYTIHGIVENGQLTEQEKFWLVSHVPRSASAAL